MTGALCPELYGTGLPYSRLYPRPMYSMPGTVWHSSHLTGGVGADEEAAWGVDEAGWLLSKSAAGGPFLGTVSSMSCSSEIALVSAMRGAAVGVPRRVPESATSIVTPGSRFCPAGAPPNTTAAAHTPPVLPFWEARSVVYSQGVKHLLRAHRASSIGKNTTTASVATTGVCMKHACSGRGARGGARAKLEGKATGTVGDRATALCLMHPKPTNCRNKALQAFSFPTPAPPPWARFLHCLV